ncbi:CoA-binding protein [Aurantibacter aestuarii]|uniref:CoA-binding protein n=1 Tax=Aurantibacter aestuarii TaxID=1266046 RepID=A0A2T1N9T2_9FLAO|nr:CoA-binding protein [Aurantibacter aestuarii]PSG88636.1 CoA-binding protein [Aurantibacter aestuarii]
MNKKTLVIGASTNPNRYSNRAIKALRGKNIETVAIGLRDGEVADVQINTNLKSYEDIDSVTLYLNPKRQVEYYDYIISLSPKRVIFNPGTENFEFYKILENANIEVEVACTLVLLATQQY